MEVDPDLMTGVLVRGRNLDTDTRGWRQGTERCNCKPRNARSCQKLPEPEERQSTDLLCTSRRNHSRGHLDFGLLASRL